MPRSTLQGPRQFRAQQRIDSSFPRAPGMEHANGGTVTAEGAPTAGTRSGVTPCTAIATAVQDKGPAAERYSRFHAAVSRAQLLAWLAELAPRRGVGGGSSRRKQAGLAGWHRPSAH